MSFFTDSPDTHDLFVGIAIRRLLSRTDGGQVLCADGGLPFTDCIRPACPSLWGYKPDAIVATDSSLYLVEAKSAVDLSTKHSEGQFRRAKTAMDLVPSAKYFLFIYDVRSKAVGCSGDVLLVDGPNWEVEYANISGEYV